MARKPAPPRDPGFVDPEDVIDDDQAIERELEQASVGDIALLDDARFADVKWSVWRFRTDAEMRGDPQGERTEYVGTMYGPIDALEFRQQFGGGTFDVRGYVPRIDAVGNKRGLIQRYRPRVSIAAPRRNLAQDPTTVTVETGPVGSPNATDQLLRELIAIQKDAREERLERYHREMNDRMLTMMQAIAQRPAEAAGGGATSIGDVIGAVAALDKLRGGKGDLNTEFMQAMINTFRQGLEIGQEREPIDSNGNDPNPWGPAVAKGLDILQSFITKTRQPMRPNGRPPSEARVVETPPTPSTPTSPPPPVEQQQFPARWHTAVESLYRSMTMQQDPRDLAPVLEGILNSDEIEQLRMFTAVDVLSQLRPIITPQYPGLDTDQGRVYLDAVLAELRMPTDGEEQDDVESVATPIQ